MNANQNRKIVFMCPLYQENNEKKIIANVVNGFNIAPNLLQWNIINGMNSNLNHGIQIINALPIGIWIKEYKKLFLRSKKWKNRDCECFEIGSINLPFVKQIIRYAKAKHILNSKCKNGDSVIVYSTYAPFLKACVNCKKNIQITLIVADLPQYYDLGKTSAIKKMLRKIQNKRIYNYISKVHKFVLLTEQMKDAINVGQRDYIVLEGICKNVNELENVYNNEANKRIIFYAGGLLYKFGILDLLNAFTNIEDEDTELWICGKGEAEKEIKANSLKDLRIKYFGYCSQEKVSILRNQSDILVNPRKPEGEYTKYSFPSKTMEYMASGKVVVMYKLAGIPDEYFNYVIAVDESNERPLESTLRLVLSKSKEERQEIGKASREFVIHKKNPIIQSRRILDLVTPDWRGLHDSSIK